jgi:hypothetical protein
MAESLCVFDQYKIDAYGAITVDALGLGVPVITAHSCENDKAYFGSCAPVFTAHNSEEVIKHLSLLVYSDNNDLKQHAEHSIEWYEGNLSEEVSLRSRLFGYQTALGIINE